MGRRQFLIVSIASAASLGIGKVTKLLGSISARASEKDDAVDKKKIKGVVVYYSATGSTGKIAGAIHKGMKSVIDCDVAPIKKIDPKKMAKYDVVAIGGPIWYFRETANLRNYVYNIPRMDGKLCIQFCTHGTNPDGFFYSLSSQILKKGLTIIGWNDWYGGCSHVLHQPSPYFTDGHPDEKDLQEAEAFGKEMAERARKIYAGERGLIPEIPAGAEADSLWVPNGYEGSGGPSGMGGGMPGSGMAGENTGDAGGVQGGGGPGGGRGMPGNANAATMIPTIDLSKCIFSRCRACMDLCLVNAIDFSLAVSSAPVSGLKFLVKEACLHCAHPLCEKACSYDAITCDNGTKTEHVFDMKKCTYPECRLCVENCPMDSISFTQNPPYIPHIKRNCEGCDICWCVCPKDAISIPNIESTHARLTPSSPNDGFFAALNEAEKTGRFRRLVPLDKIGWNNIVYKNPDAPRVVLHEENYPYDVKG